MHEVLTEIVLTLDALCGLADFGRAEVPSGCRAEGCTLHTLAVRERTGIAVVELERDGPVQPSPPPDLALRAGDVLVVYGTGEQLAAVHDVLV